LEIFGQPSYDYIFLATHCFLLINTYFVYQLLNRVEFSETLLWNEKYENIYPKGYTTQLKFVKKLKDE
jgi:hypothetical protein